MKRLWVGLVSAAVAFGAEAIAVKGGKIAVRYDDQFLRRLEWSGQSAASIVAFDATVVDGVVIGGQSFGKFRVDAGRTSQRRVTDSEFGPAVEATVVGTLQGGPGRLRMERTTRVLLPDKFPDAAIFQTTFRNLSERPVRLERVYSQRVLLDRRLGEPDQASYNFASFQGGAYKWGADYALMRLKGDFKQSNFQGVDDIHGVEEVGGGMPFVDVWSPAMGVALCHLEKAPQWLSLPVEVRQDGRVDVGVVEAPQSKLGQKEVLAPGESYQTVMTAVIFHRLDFYDPLGTYGRLLRARGVAIPETSPERAYDPYFKTWGWGRNFTLDKIRAVLPELRSMGIGVMNLDDGWFDFMGDWDVNRSAGKFPNGEADMVGFVRELHLAGFRSSLWWYPLGVDRKSKLAVASKELLVEDENGVYPLDTNDYYQLCPAYEPALAHVRKILTKFVSSWGYDGVYTDFRGLSAVPACFNKAHHHGTPLESFQALPKLFETIQTTLRALRPDGVHEVCICSLPHSPYNMPFYDVASASDPVNTLQVRSRVKVEKAIRGGNFAVGDCYQVPMREWEGFSVPESFESAMGTGAQLTTFYSSLNQRERTLWQRWLGEYKELQLSKAEYLNLYDMAFDQPETHVVRKGADLYYGIFSDFWARNKRIELRGLDRQMTYEVYDYANRQSLGTVTGAQPFLRVGFKDSLLVRVRPVAK